jgi:N-acetylneuraminic acid mutarotase
MMCQEWSVLPDFPGIERDDAAAFVIGDDVYVGTGMDVGFNLTADWYRFNTIDQSWNAVAALPGGGRQYALAIETDGYAYVIGGSTATGSTNEVWRYDPDGNEWNREMPLLEAVLAASGGPLHGRLHVVGGIGANGTLSDLHQIYDPLAGAWTLASSPPMSVHRGMSFASGDGVHVVGGATQDFVGMDHHLRYDANGAWSTLAALPDARYAGDACAAHAGAVVVGGFEAGPPVEVRDEVWRYDRWTDAWYTLPPLPAGPRRGAVLVEVGGRLYFGTGSDATQRYRDWWTLEVPVTIGEGSFAPPGPFPVPTAGLVHLSSSLVPTDRMLSLLNSNGQEVGRWPATEQVMDLSGRPPGVYVLQIVGESVRRYRLVKTP